VVDEVEPGFLGEVGDVLLPTCAEVIDAYDCRAGVE
jgi:hypothetical protein